MWYILLWCFYVALSFYEQWPCECFNYYMCARCICNLAPAYCHLIFQQFIKLNSFNLSCEWVPLVCCLVPSFYMPHISQCSMNVAGACVWSFNALMHFFMHFVSFTFIPIDCNRNHINDTINQMRFIKINMLMNKLFDIHIVKRISIFKPTKQQQQRKQSQ